MRKLLNFKCLADIKAIWYTELKYPLRVKAAAVVSLCGCLINALILIVGGYEIYKLIDYIQTQVNFLKNQPPDGMFMVFKLNFYYIISNSEGVTYGESIIKHLKPVFICVVIGVCCGVFITLFSIMNMFYMLKKIILIIKVEGDGSPTLERIWKFSSHNAMFFSIQFIVNSLFLENLVAFSVFWTTFVISNKEFELFILSFIQTRGIGFWLSWIPLFLW